MKRILFLLLLFFGVQEENKTQAAEPIRISIPALDLNLAPTFTKLDENVSLDFPAGAWLMPWFSTNQASATITLNQTLPPGDYSVFVNVGDYDHGDVWQYSIADATSPLQPFNDRDNNTIYWSERMVVTTTYPTNKITFNFFRTSPTPVTQNGWAHTYVTSDTNEMVFRDDRAISFVYPTSFDNTPPVPGNRFPNSSFECGLNGWRNIRVAHEETLEDLWSAAYAHTGTRSFKLPVLPGEQGQHNVQSAPFTLGTNKTHTVSVWVRTSHDTATFVVRMDSMWLPPAGLPSTYGGFVYGTATTTWTRYSFLAEDVPSYPDSQYYLSFTSQGSSGVPYTTEVFFDDVLVEEGDTLNPWAPLAPLEFDIRTTSLNPVYWASEAPQIVIRGFNNSSESITRDVNYKIMDYTNGVTTGSIPLTVGPGAFGNSFLNLATNKFGHFRGWFWITNQNSDTETTWLVIEQPATTNIDLTSFAGMHANANAEALAIAQKAGFHWQRGLSLGRILWADVEAVSNVFVWPNLDIYTNYGLSVMLNLGADAPANHGTTPPTPTWINPLTLNTNFFGRYVSNAVVQYPFVHHWEVWNEPDQDSHEVPNLAHYAELLRIASTMIKAIRPTDIVIGGGGVYGKAHLDTIMAALGSDTNKVDKWSIHAYPGAEVNSFDLKTSYVDVGWDVFNTESGSGDKSSRTGPRSNFRTAGNYVIDWKSADYFYDAYHGNLTFQAKNFITCIGNGLTKQFYYDGGQRTVAVNDLTSRQFTYLDADDGPKVKLAMLAALWSRIDYSIGQGPLSVSGCSAFGFVKSGVPMVAIWSTTNKTVALSGVSASNLRIYDIVGNRREASSTTIEVGKMPIYVEGLNGMSWSTLSTAFTSGTVSNVADTEAPSLILTYFPRMAPNDSLSHFRWFAIDNDGVPIEGGRDLIEYRSRYNDGEWDPWSGKTWNNLVEYPTTFDVQARDRAGNISEVSFSSVEEGGGEPGPAPDPEFSNLLFGIQFQGVDIK